MVKTFTPQDASKALILVRDITEDLREEVELLSALQSQGAYPTEPESKKHISKLKHHFEELKQVGCVSNEPHLGIIDFPSFRNGEPIFLCWQMGEEAVQYWHGVDEQHSSRRELTESSTAVA